MNFAASFFEWFAEEGRRNYGDHIPAPVDGKTILTIREPVGVAALITPVSALSTSQFDWQF